MNMERQQDPDWADEIKKAGLNLRPFNDVITGYKAPGGYGEPVAKDVMLGGVLCDVYHTDHRPEDTTHRVFIHKKKSI